MLSQPRRTAVSTAVLALALALAGCQPATTTPAPVPSYRCTPEAGGAEFDCSQHQYDDMVAKDKLYAEAEAVYRKYVAEDARIMRMGGVLKPTPGLLATTTGEFLVDAMKDYRGLAKDEITAVGSDPSLVVFQREPGKSKGGSIAAATTCVDGTSIEFFSGSKSLGRGRIARDVTYFVRVEGTLKIAGADGKQVKTCG